MKFFNTSGPCNPEWHYMLPASERLPDALGLIAQRHYFVLHAPRQTGKTTALMALASELTDEDTYLALRFSCESAEPAGDDYEAAELLVLEAIARSARVQDISPDLLPPDPWPDAPPGGRLAAGLGAWAAKCSRPLVLFFDEIDALRGESLRSVLRQLRDGYSSRPEAFPMSVVLCGLRDVRDYKVAAGGNAARLGSSSPFNIKVESLRLGDFTEPELRTLYAQHTAETEQEFTENALALAWEYTQGQPWLVNALAREIIEGIPVAPPTLITAQHVEQAKERLIQTRATHLDSLVSKLREPRVRRIIEPVMAGDLALDYDSYDDDMSYVTDLGLIARDRPIRIANPIYQEVITRVLSAREQDAIDVNPRSFIAPDGRLDMPKVLSEFADFWRRDGEVLSEGTGYHEIAPHLVMMAYLQRVVNGGGQISREYALGRRRVDVLIRWTYADAQGTPAEQYEAIELKVWAPKRSDPLEEGLAQLDGYLDSLNLDHGTLVIFNRRPDAGSVEDRVRIEHVKTATGRPVALLRA